MKLRSALEEMVNRGGSDLHIFVGFPPVMRINGALEPTEQSTVTPEDMVALAEQILTPKQLKEFETKREIDFGFGVPGLGRFRANVCKQRGTIAMVFRLVPMEIPPLESLMLPSVIKELCMRSRGLILVTGITGSGKSTTLASMLQLINQEKRAKIVTIEDPIEFLHAKRNGLVAQREVGTDTDSFSAALRHVLRQDPDVIMVGEIRDLETMSIAITAANTGHLLMSTLHTIDAAQSVNRVISFFPTHQHTEIRLLLASCLQAIVSMRLIPRMDGQGRVPAVEVMLCTPTIQEYIIDPEKTGAIRQAIQEGHVQYGMQTFDQSLMKLYKEGFITYEEALTNSTSPDEFALRVKGIEASSDNSWSQFESVTDDLEQKISEAG
ncbi:MAG: twitching motility protein PilT [Gemmatimonadota bacterium]|nr:MAG: twitching motility protein PilT [Gemmatimonadota bacterium]